MNLLPYGAWLLIVTLTSYFQAFTFTFSSRVVANLPYASFQQLKRFYNTNRAV